MLEKNETLQFLSDIPVRRLLERRTRVLDLRKKGLGDLEAFLLYGVRACFTGFEPALREGNLSKFFEPVIGLRAC